MTGLISLGLILTSYEDWTMFRDADFFIEWNRDNPLICLRFYGRYFHLTLAEIEQLAQFWTEYVLPVIPDTDKTIANWDMSKIEYGPVRYSDGGDDFAWWEDEDETEAGKLPLALFQECEFQVGPLRLQNVSTENIRELVTRFSTRSEQQFDLVEHYLFKPVRAYHSFVVRPVGDRLEIEWIQRKRRWFAPIIEFLLPSLLSNWMFKPLAMWTVAEQGALAFSQVEAQQVQDLALRMLAIVGRRYIDSRPALAELAALKIPGLA